MHRACSFPGAQERSRTKERLESSLSGLCELELRKQRQECLVLGALALGDPGAHDDDPSGGAVPWFWGQENWTLRRQLSALQSSPWGLMQTLEQQVGDLSVDTEDQDRDSRPSSGFYESSEGQSPRVNPGDPAEVVSPRMQTKDRPKSLGDPHLLNGDADSSGGRCGLPRSFSAPYPPLEGIAEEGTARDPWHWDAGRDPAPWYEQLNEDYHQALRVESYMLSLIQRHALPPRPTQPRTTGHGSLTKRNHSKDRRRTDLQQPLVDLASNHRSHSWGCESSIGHGVETPSLEDDSFLDLPYPQCRTQSEAGRLPSPLPPQDLNLASSNLCCEPPSPQHYLYGPSPLSHKDHLVSAQYIPGCSPRHHSQEPPHRSVSPPDPHGIKPRSAKRTYNEKLKCKKSSSKTSRSQSENSVLGQRVLLERRYSTTERHHHRTQVCEEDGVQLDGGGRRWCSNLELSQDEGEVVPELQAPRRPARKPRQGPSGHHAPKPQRWHPDVRDHRAPLCQGEEGYGAAAPAESESSMSEVYSPASSSLSSDSDESGGLVWPQQLPPRLSTSSSPQAAAADPPSQKAFVKIKASHALKKKILRFRSGSLKVMTTV